MTQQEGCGDQRKRIKVIRHRQRLEPRRVVEVTVRDPLDVLVRVELRGEGPDEVARDGGIGHHHDEPFADVMAAERLGQRSRFVETREGNDGAHAHVATDRIV